MSPSKSRKSSFFFVLLLPWNLSKPFFHHFYIPTVYALSHCRVIGCYLPDWLLATRPNDKVANDFMSINLSEYIYYLENCLSRWGFGFGEDFSRCAPDSPNTGRNTCCNDVSVSALGFYHPPCPTSANRKSFQSCHARKAATGGTNFFDMVWELRASLEDFIRPRTGSLPVVLIKRPLVAGCFFFLLFTVPQNTTCLNNRNSIKLRWLGPASYRHYRRSQMFGEVADARR